ncbi:hypothetical protein HD554DRAFT_2047071 [Boletus coccyginus]|nr:hypothetical protein HD554DRAFT_2047071 [Boletus coccyginus]
MSRSWRLPSRPLSTALHFYQNRQLDIYAAKEAHRLTLRQLVFFGRQMDKDRLIKARLMFAAGVLITIDGSLRAPTMSALNYQFESLTA